jgi:diacylglycerol kinase (ATP)
VDYSESDSTFTEHKSRQGRLMISFLRSRINSFHNAFSGLWYVIRTQKNTWIHTIATLLVLILGVWLNLSSIAWSILILTISMVWMAEFLNTALEAICDLASPVKHPLAKIGKDVGAAAVLITALSSVVIGILLLGPAFLSKTAQFFH